MKHIIVSFALVAALSLSGTTQMAFASSMENQMIYDFQDSDVEEAGEEAGNKGEAVGKAAGEMPEEGLTSEPAAEAAEAKRRQPKNRYLYSFISSRV